MKNIKTIKQFIERMDKFASTAKYVEYDPNYHCTYDASLVWNNMPQQGGEIMLAFIVDRYSDYTDKLYVSMKDGAIYGNPMKPLEAVDFDNPICCIDKEIANVLLPIYKAKYLDSWTEYVRNIAETYPEKLKGFEGIRDGFSVLCNDLGVLPWTCEGDIRKIAKAAM